MKQTQVKSNKAFLGGTCNGSKWRDRVIKKLKIDYYNPIVKTWTDDVYQREIEERQSSKFCVYVITPKLKGFYSIAEVIDDTHDKTKTTVFCYLKTDAGQRFGKFQIKSLEAIGKMVIKNGGVWVKNLNELVNYLNSNKL